MSLNLRAWLLPHRARNRLRRTHPDRHAYWRELISELAPGRSFADIGGIWGVDGDISFWAEEAGATSVTLFDATPPSAEFERKHAARSSKVRFVQGDIHEHASLQAVGEHDIVWCTGVLYHTPDPYRVLENLRTITREKLVVGTQVIPEVPGFPQACVYYPMLDEKARAAFVGRGRGTMLGLSTPFTEVAPGEGYAAWWWGITPSALRAMLATARFEVEREFAPSFRLLDVVAGTVAAPAFNPPPDLARVSGADRA